ncbi:MAG: DNA-protecting protein DprA [Chlorobiaceae bacterium]|nr:DNA-protecting protein DprA [Chlorobiaceae bacterium]MBA4309320.1 DNA-protecting protein DprA [Chlorobiaceae bacterium]
MSKFTLDELINLKILLSLDRIGPVKVISLFNKFGSVENIFEASLNELTNIDGVNKSSAEKIINSRKQKNELQNNYLQELEILEKKGIEISTYWDENYPFLLKKIYDPPIIIYSKGKFLEQDNYSIAIVGTREPTSYGKNQTEKFAEEISTSGITIVSGLARGVDSIAHNTALKNNGRTIAVLGNGLDIVYPPENKKLYERIPENGVLISEFELGAKPDATNFPRRNRIIAGLSLGCLVVESDVTGGAIQTAHFALDQDREVFAVPGNLSIKQSEGTNHLIQKGEAKLVKNGSDIFEELNYKLNRVLKDNKKLRVEIIEMNMFEEKIYNVISDTITHIDEISIKSQMSMSECLVHLLSLEFKGAIKQLPGKNFSKI